MPTTLILPTKFFDSPAALYSTHILYKVAVYGLHLYVTLDDEYNKLPGTRRANCNHFVGKLLQYGCL